ncbi:protein eva-1 C [Nephila pilipes]|uniref:Protein eva-1 C n=1 Tax=Nephila pilipes TaxID=299642 RepID=A0A8X6I6A1_NEPPI|nr:protein eva-1 C [Nephila pilipes]GFS32024.1 protein eva-1 C [Nephila pilipes]
MDLSVRVEISLVLTYLFFQFLSISFASDNYEKWHRTLTPFQSHACDGEELHLRCTANTVISVHYVFYGRQIDSGHLCSHKSATYVSKTCESSKALQVIHERCHKNRVCRLFISPETFRDDPCPGVRKFIEVMYKCRPDGFLNKIVCEGGQLDLACPAGHGLTIFSASYGTTVDGVIECYQNEEVEPKDCLIDHADETIRSICAGKQNCSLKADDRTFGNPGCEGKKHLKVAYNCVGKALLLQPNRRPVEESIQTTSFPAWARGIDQSSQNSYWPRVYDSASSTRPSDSSKLEMQSDEVPTNYKKETLTGDQELVGFMSKWMSAHKYMTGNKDKLILYVSISLAIGFLVFVTVLAGRFVITRLETRRSSNFNITPETEDQFFSDSDLEQYDPPDPLPPPPILNYTASMKRHDSDASPRAPISPGNELNHYFS